MGDSFFYIWCCILKSSDQVYSGQKVQPSWNGKAKTYEENLDPMSPVDAWRWTGTCVNVLLPLSLLLGKGGLCRRSWCQRGYFVEEAGALWHPVGPGVRDPRLKKELQQDQIVQARMLNAATEMGQQIECGGVATASHVHLQPLESEIIWLLLHFCLIHLI